MRISNARQPRRAAEAFVAEKHGRLRSRPMSSLNWRMPPNCSILACWERC